MNRHESPVRVFLYALVLFLAGSPLLAQSDTSSLSGTITDASGAVVSKANIVLENNATHAESRAGTNENGSFTITNLPPGSYNARIEATGFQSVDLKDVRLDPNIGRRVDVQMKVGEASTSVTVEAGANAVQTESGSVGQLITEEQVRSIQLNGRNPLYLSQLEPGVVRGNSMAAFSFGLDNNINVNGARSQESLVTFDGAPMVRTRSNGTSVGVADVDSTSQVQVLTTSYPAEYGRTSGGQTRIIPKSGTSALHGSAFEYFRNTVLNANTWSRNNTGTKRQAFRFNQFGWNLNGPVVFPGFNTSRDKLFFLVGQEWIKYIHDDFAQQKVPTALMRTGNFSELLSTNIFYSTPVQIVNPITGAPYPNNVIPAGQLSPNGMGMLNAYPAPNTANNANNWSDSAAYTEKQRKDSLVIDYIPAPSHHLRFSLLNYNYDNYEPHFGNFNLNPRIFHRPNQIGVAHYTWTISPTLVNDVYASGAADHVDINVDTSLGRYDRTKYGINYPYLYAASTKTLPNKVPTLQIANFGTLDGGPYPSRSGGIVYDFGDTLTKVVGSHTLKFGGLWEYAGQNNYDQISVDNTRPGTTNNQNGLFVFTDARGGPTSKAAVANVALGLFDTYGEIGQRSYTLFRGNMFEGFAQDQWRTTPKLVLEFGVRYSVMMPYHALWGNQAFFSPRDYNPALAPSVSPTTGFLTGGDPLNGVVIPGSGFPDKAKGHVPDNILNGGYQRLFRGYGSGYHPTVYSNIQPRVGFAYQVSPGTVIRAGGGRYVQRLGISDTVHVGGNAPFQPASGVSAGSVDNPGGIGTNATPLAFTSQSYIYPNPESWGWNVTVEHEFPEIGTFTLSYVGRRGYHLEQLANVNQLPVGTKPANAAVPITTNTDSLRPYRGFSTIIEAQNNGGSFYHSLQANLKRRLTKGFLFGVAYTWSKSLDYGSSNGTNIPNAYDNGIMYGPSDFDTRHVLVMNYVWNIPYGTHATNFVARSVFGNWQFSGIIQAQTGQPVGVSRNFDAAGVGAGSGNQYYVHTRDPLLPHQFAGPRGTGQWFETSVYQPAAPGTFAGRGSRNNIYSPGFSSFNAALQKSMHVIPGHDNHQLVFKAEAFNYPNHPNWDKPDVSPTSGTFGRVTGKGNTYASERQFQFSLRYAF